MFSVKFERVQWWIEQHKMFISEVFLLFSCDLGTDTAHSVEVFVVFLEVVLSCIDAWLVQYM